MNQVFFTGTTQSCTDCMTRDEFASCIEIHPISRMTPDGWVLDEPACHRCLAATREADRAWADDLNNIDARVNNS